MHLFYYQQRLFDDETEPIFRDGRGSSGREPGASSEVAAAPAAAGRQARRDSSPAPASIPAAVKPPLESIDERIRQLEARRAEMQGKLEADALRRENERLESQVLHMQEDFVALQGEFQEMKERFSEELAALDKKNERQQADTGVAERRVCCTEDLVRFHEEQRRLLSQHWKAQCADKDERIRSLSVQLTDYTIDWQHLGTQRQTEASLSHEVHCLDDRHRELGRCLSRQNNAEERLRLHLEERKAEAAAELTEAKASTCPQDAALSSESAGPATRLGAPSQQRTMLRSKLGWLKRVRESWEGDAAAATSSSTASSTPSWPHRCIWRDELDVREHQLEKIAAQFDKTNDARQLALEALAKQRGRHEELQRQHRDLEAELAESEPKRQVLQRRCSEVQRVEAELRKALEERGIKIPGDLGGRSSAAP
eukprot:TRINITY_DN83431_c0_g1_i1.p1 TRINITY_DN83431_c0_g1~~TRINITY_DN83431_c0_g1_i1.p1  ORF type:complete len:426 (-),score=132.96 TRINITY_DN83431_c0_g1_i1:72-1349(-)